MATTTGGSVLEVAEADDDGPLFRRAKPRDAVDLALSTFERGNRVDLQTLARKLAVSPPTLNRWFGSRARLLEQVVERLALQFTDNAQAEARGEGDERVCDFARRVIETSVQHEALLAFVEREPQLALRIVLGETGAVHRVLAEGLASVVADTYPPGVTEKLADHVDAIVQVATALQWATFTIGDKPQIELAVDIIRMTLVSKRAT